MNITRAFQAADPSLRLHAALAAGTDADPAYLVPLMERMGDEPDFFVRDMLTWAITRYPVSETFPLLIEVLNDPQARSQARSQALHTLSKIQAPGTWEVLTTPMLHHPMWPSARLPGGLRWLLCPMRNVQPWLWNWWRSWGGVMRIPSAA